MPRLPNLNVLRFFLAMVVMLGHISRTSKTLGLPHFPDIPILQKTNLAVYFFFSLSGFLIIRLLYLESQKGRLNLMNFYKRRMLRILPLYFIVLFTGVFIYFYLLPWLSIETGFKNDLGELLKYFVFFLPNVYIAQHSQDVGGIIYILWSIGLEEQFYLFIPLVIMAFPRHIVKALIVLVIVHIIASHQFPSIAGNYFNYYYFLAGGIISILSLQGKLYFLWRKDARVVLLILFFVLFFTHYIVIRNDILYYLVTSAIAGLFICSIADFPIIDLKNKSLNYLGEISYGLYMYHMICVTGILYLFSRLQIEILFKNQLLSTLAIHISVISLTVISAHLSYRYIEKYFMNLKKRFR